MRLAVLALLLSAGAGLTAPVPKGAQNQKPASPDGVWQVTAASFWNGKLKFDVVGTYMQIEGERFSYIEPDLERLGQNGLPHALWNVDPNQPRQRRFVYGGMLPPPQGIPWQPPKGSSAILEVDGDTLRFAYVCGENKPLTECKPADDVYYFELRRPAPAGK